MKNFRYVFNDTETTGVALEDRAIESAHAYVDANGNLLEYQEDLFNPGVPIGPFAASVHGYRNSDIKGKDSFEKTKSYKRLIDFSNEDDTYYVAHNAPFDIGMLKKENINFKRSRIIDTLKVAKHCLSEDLAGTELEKYITGDVTEPESKGLQYLRYFFDAYFEPKEPEYMKKLGVDYIRPHTAMSDILVLWIFTNFMAEHFNLTPDDMVEMSNKPSLEKKIAFGKEFEHGTPYEEVITTSYTAFGKPKMGYNYLIWAVENMAMNIDREYSIRYYLSKAVLKGQIPLTPDTKKYLMWGVIFAFNKDELSEVKEDLRVPVTGYINGTNKKIAELEELINSSENPEQSDIDELEKTVFMKNYFDDYRDSLFNL